MPGHVLPYLAGVEHMTLPPLSVASVPLAGASISGSPFAADTVDSTQADSQL
jgi:hypothetical protein